MKACATGEHLKEATITRRKAGKGQQEYLIVKMNDVIITSVQPGGARRRRHAENVACSSPRSSWSTSRRRPDGSLDAGVHFKYDIKAQQGRLVTRRHVSTVGRVHRDRRRSP